MKKRRLVLLLFLMVVSMLFQSVGLEVLAAPGDQYIATGNVNFRSGPSTSFDKIDYILKGSQVEHISRHNSYWEKIRYNGREGYASSKYFKLASPTGDSAQEYITIVNINFRSGPSTSYASQGIVPKGTTVEFISSANDWMKVTYNGVTGYMYAKYLSPKTESQAPPEVAEPYITTAGVNFRTGPSTSYASRGIVPKGTPVEFISSSNNWAKVIYDGNAGYMYAKYLSPKMETAAPPEVTEPYITTVGVNFRTGPSTSYTSRGIVPKGTPVEFISSSNNWAKVIYNGDTGFMFAKYITPQAESTTPGPTPNKAVKVGIPWTGNQSNSLVTKTASSIKLAGGEVVYLSKVSNAIEAAAQLARVDAVVPTGGSDIGAKYYNQSTSKYMEYVHATRDLSDYHIIRMADSMNMPMLGLCRGAQFMNVVRGGALYQDIDKQRSRRNTYISHRGPNYSWNYHNITVYDNSKLSNAMGKGNHYVNSMHHQGIRTLGRNIKVTARSADSLIEGFEATDRDFYVGVQFHPEFLTTGENASANLAIFESLIEAANKNE